MKIIWNKNIEPVAKKEIQRHLKPFLWLVPGWCQELNIWLSIIGQAQPPVWLTTEKPFHSETESSPELDKCEVKRLMASKIQLFFLRSETLRHQPNPSPFQLLDEFVDFLLSDD